MDHIYKYNVTPPAMNHTDYYNRKVWYSMLVQAVVNHNYLFKDIHIGWPGRVHNARVLVLVPDPKPTPARIAFSIVHREGRVW